MFWPWLRGKKYRRRPDRTARPWLERLERRDLLTTVANLQDAGAGSLRAAIASGGNIDFQAGLNGTISLSSPLSISGNVDIDGGANVITIDGGGSKEMLDIANGATVNLSSLIFSDGSAQEGGAIYNGGDLSVTHCSFENNVATDTNLGGGAIANFGNLIVEGCDFSSNQAAKGGAIWNSASATGCNINDSSFRGNTAATGAALDDAWFSNTLNLTNDTFEGNTATGADTGVVQVGASATILLTNCTIADNTSGTGASGAVFANGGTANYINTIVANNSGSQFAASGGGSLISLGHNISSDATGNLSAAGDLSDTDPMIGPLQNNGGPTQTMALLAGSPALNAGDNSAANLTADDARGLPRILNGTTDIGALEAIEVDTTADNDDSDYSAGQLSLREAIALAPLGTALLFASGLAGGTIDLSAGGGVGSALDLNQDLTIDASTLPGGLTVSGGNAVLVFNIEAGAQVNLAGLTIADGNGGANDGGGINNSGTLTLTNCTLQNNVAADGGGILNDGTLIVDRCTFSANQADNLNGVGGALWSDGFSVSTLTNSTFTGNSAAYGAAVEYDPVSPGQFTNDTFYGNTATGADTGIVEADFAAEIDLTNCTIANNTAVNGAGGGVSAFGGTIQFVNTIVAGNTDSQFVTDVGGSGGLLISLGHNISSDGTGDLTAAGDLPNTDPLLGPPGSYDGSTFTLALLPGSPAIDAGDSAAASAQDQRGINRVGQADIGAFESRGFSMSLTSGNNQTVATTANFAPLAVTVASGFGEPVQNGRVAFTIPATGASVSFGSGATATIDGAGLASNTPLANAFAGSYQISASASGAASPIVFDLTNHGAAELDWTQQPTDVVSGAVLSPGISVQILDENGQPLNTNGTVTLAANGPGSFIGGSTTSVQAVNGVAIFNDLSLGAAGRYTLTASLPNVPDLVSQSFNVTANHLAFTTEPTATFGGGVNATVAAEDALGKIDTHFQGTISLAMAPSALGSLTGVTAVVTTNGVATFTDLSATSTNLNTSIIASSASLPSVSSSGLNLVVVSTVVPLAVPDPVFGPGPNPDANTAEVRGLYRSVLGRDADSGGLHYWVSQLAAGAGTQAVAQFLWYSSEHRDDEIDQYYTTFLHRQADAAGRLGWLSLLSTTGNESLVVAGFLTSSEYLQLHADNRAWLTAIYGDVLDRTPSEAELQYWLSQLVSGASGRMVAEAIVSSPESDLRIVRSYYAALLNRMSDAAGEGTWLQLLLTGLRSPSTAAVDFLSSGEYRNAAQASIA